MTQPLGAISIVGRERVVNKLNKMSGQLDDWGKTLDKAADLYYDFVDDVFRTEGAAGGAAWKELSPLRKEKRRRAGFPEGPILQTYGQLREVATSNEVISTHGVEGGQRYTKKSVELYIAGDKVRHQYGFKNDNPRYSPVPKREFWPWDDRVYDMLMNPFESWADDWIKGG